MAAKGKVNIEVTADTKDAESKLSSLKNVSVIAFAAIAAAATKALTTLFDWAKLGADFTDLKENFNGLAASFNKDADSMLQSFREASGGMINDIELLKQANNALLKGVQPSEFEEILSMADQLGDATGNSATQIVETISNAIALQKEKGLASIGIMTDMKAANEAYAASIGTTADKLTDQQKQQVFATEAIRAAKENVDKLSTESVPKLESLNDMLERSNTKWENMKTKIGVLAGPIVKSAILGFEEIGESISNIFGKDGEDSLQSFSVMFSKVTYSIGAGIGLVIRQFTEIFKQAFSYAEEFVKKIQILAGKGDLRHKFEDMAATAKEFDEKRRVMDSNYNTYVEGLRQKELDNYRKIENEFTEAKKSGIQARGAAEKESGNAPGGSGEDLDKAGADAAKQVASSEAAMMSGAGDIASQIFNTVASSYIGAQELALQKMQRKQELFNYVQSLYIAKVMEGIQQEIDAERAKYDQMKADQESFYAQKLESLSQSVLSEAEQGRQKIAIQKDQAAAAAKLEKEKNDRLAQLEKEKQEKEKKIKKEGAVIEWTFKSAQLELEKRIKIGQNTVAGISNAAQALGGAIATLGPIAGGIVGAGLSSMILSNMAASNSFIASQFVLPPPELFAASGAIVNRPTVAMVGETGPEAIVPLSNSGGGGGVTIVVNVANMFADDRASVSRLATMLDQELRSMQVTGKSVFGAEFRTA